MAASKLLTTVRREIRRRNYSYKTEQAYVGWIKRFIYFHNITHPKEMGATEVEHFLNYLANEQNVAASTQNQALSALVFLYKQVFDVKILQLDNLKRAHKPINIPVVLAPNEVHQILFHTKGLKHRRVMLPKTCLLPLKDQINHVTKQHQQDLKNGVGETLLPKALAKKYPQEGKKMGWQYIFCSNQWSKDPRSG
jgi:hypothetical protein